VGVARFFVEGVRAVGDRVALDAGDARKAMLVLRMTDGAAFDAIDSAGTTFAARLATDGAAAYAELAEIRVLAREATLAIDLAQGVPKGQKMDFVVEKATELGVRAIVPFVSKRTVAEASPAKIERWRRLAKTAAQQCGRERVPRVADASGWDAVLASFAAYDVVLMPWEVADAQPLRTVLPALIADAASVLLIVGPEGGIAHDDAERAIAAGAHAISLGARILRTETAALALVSAIRYERAEL
jgi:16S rRNA (uracil1498-N3)-methyltransferase